MQKMKKEFSQGIHFRKRLDERFDFQLNHEQRRRIVAMIQRGEGELIESQSFRLRKYRFEIEGQTVDIIYDKKRGTLVTALYPEEKEASE